MIEMLAAAFVAVAILGHALVLSAVLPQPQHVGRGPSGYQGLAIGIDAVRLAAPSGPYGPATEHQA